MPMSVSELRELLADMPDDAPVVVEVRPGFDVIQYVAQVVQTRTLNEHGHPLVFIITE